jgi:uncharacterized protein
MELYRDRDYLQDLEGHIYQVIGSVHPEKGVFALQKYAQVKNDHEHGKDPIESPRIEDYPNRAHSLLNKHQHPISFWKQKGTDDKYIRILPNYSAEAAAFNIKNHKYQQFSHIFQMPMIQVPKTEIKIHWKPELKFQEFQNVFNKGSFKQKQSLDKLQRETLEVGYLMEEEFNVNVANLGITGSIVWDGQHDHSDLDFNIYGYANTQKIINHPPLDSEKKGLRGYRKIEILPIAEKMAIKTGLPMEECFEYIYKKPYHIFYRDRKVSLTFVPNLSEILQLPLYHKDTMFENQQPCTVRGRIVSSEFGYYYPGLFQIHVEEIVDKLSGKNSPNDTNLIEPKQISRLLVFEHENVGYYRENDRIEIQGLLQKCTMVPNFKTLEPVETYQMMVGTKETFGHEYVRLLK